MLSIQMFRVIVDQREREIQAELRVRRLLRRETDGVSTEASEHRYSGSWRASTPRCAGMSSW